MLDRASILGNSKSISVLAENNRISDYGLCCMIHNETGMCSPAVGENEIIEIMDGKDDS